MAYDPGSDEARLGRQAQELVRWWFERAGWFVNPLAHIDDSDRTGSGAPMLTRGSERIVLPDYGIMRRGYSATVEVKGKTRFTIGKHSKRPEHGIDLDNWYHYMRYADESGMPGHLCIVEIEGGPRLLLASMAYLRDKWRPYTGEWWNNGRHAAFFLRDHFTPFTLDMATVPVLPVPIVPKVVRLRDQHRDPSQRQLPLAGF